jgi:spore germination protein
MLLADQRIRAECHRNDRWEQSTGGTVILHMKRDADSRSELSSMTQTPTRRRLSRRMMLQTVVGTGITLAGAGALLPLSSGIALASDREKMVFAWLVPYDPSSFASLQKHAEVITHLSPTWYSIDGELTISGEADRAVAQFARDRGIALVPLIKNAQFSPVVAQDILLSSKSRDKAADAIASLVLQNNYDGINIDFEGPFGASRDQYSDFLTRLGARLQPEGKLLTVDVVPQLEPVSTYADTSWAAPYDYRVLGEVCDAVMVMCYSYSDRKPGSLSPLWWLRKATTRALTQIPASKVVVGMSFYGRHWIVNGQQITHTDLKQAQALDLLAQSGAELDRPVYDATPRFTWRDAQGKHIVHFEDAKSLTAKLKVVRAASVAGATFWRLGQEDASQWKVIGQALA